jgi:hypothetical protein
LARQQNSFIFDANCHHWHAASETAIEVAHDMIPMRKMD